MDDLYIDSVQKFNDFLNIRQKNILNMLIKLLLMKKLQMAI